MWFALGAIALALIIYRKPIHNRLSRWKWRVLSKMAD